jgi:hypothetical protein
MMLINLYGGHYDGVKSLSVPGRLRSCWFAGDDLARYCPGFRWLDSAYHGHCPTLQHDA